MTTYFRRPTTCARCGEASEHSVLGSTNSFGSPDLDLRPPEMQRSTMSAWLQECPHCGYTAPDLGEESGDLSVVPGAGYAAARTDARFPPLARRFRANALLHAADPRAAGHAYLCAAWVCDDAREPALARECRGAAADSFARQKPFEDNPDGVTAGAVVVDVLRRAARFELAAVVCDTLLAFDAATGVLRQVLEYQAARIMAGDDQVHTVAEAAGG